MTDEQEEDPRNPGRGYLRRELDANRKTERWLAVKALVALAACGVLVVLRVVFFGW